MQHQADGDPVAAQEFKLFTHHGTPLRYDDSTRKLFHKGTNQRTGLVMLARDDMELHHLSPSALEATFNRTKICAVKIEWISEEIVSLFHNGYYLCARPDGTAEFCSPHSLAWEHFRLEADSPLSEAWLPKSPVGGTQIMALALQKYVGDDLRLIDLRINTFEAIGNSARPIVVWIHNELSQNYDWMRASVNIEAVSFFVFVSNWQRQAFIDHYNLPISRCIVIRNAIETNSSIKCVQWGRIPPSQYRCAYISAPYRGLDILLHAWEAHKPIEAELHIWSSRQLWGENWNDNAYEVGLFEKARRLPGVFYHGIAPNDKIRDALRGMHFLTYPSRFLETSCISVIEAMHSGCRIIAPTIGALAETSAGFGRLYPFTADSATHAKIFAEILKDEIDDPWQGNVSLAYEQVRYTENQSSWSVRRHEWLRLIKTAVERA